MSINAVEKKLGFGNVAIKRFDTNSPSIDKIISLSNFLNVSLDYLVIGKEISSSAAELNTDEQELIDIYKGLSDMNKGRLRERDEMLAEPETSVTPVINEEPEEQETIFI